MLFEVEFTSANCSFPVSFDVKSDAVPVDMGVINIVDVRPDPYQGDYEFTPTLDTQIAETEGKYMRGNVVINPIPKNYGLITYDGCGITVS